MYASLDTTNTQYTLGRRRIHSKYKYKYPIDHKNNNGVSNCILCRRPVNFDSNNVNSTCELCLLSPLSSSSSIIANSNQVEAWTTTAKEEEEMSSASAASASSSPFSNDNDDNSSISYSSVSISIHQDSAGEDDDDNSQPRCIICKTVIDSATNTNTRKCSSCAQPKTKTTKDQVETFEDDNDNSYSNSNSNNNTVTIITPPSSLSLPDYPTPTYNKPSKVYLQHNIGSNFWGPHLWVGLHSIAFGYPDNPSRKEHNAAVLFFTNLQFLLPCKKCRDHYSELIKQMPVNAFNRETLSRWIVNLHNAVNKDIGKKTIDYEQVKRLYMNKAVTACKKNKKP